MLKYLLLLLSLLLLKQPDASSSSNNNVGWMGNAVNDARQPASSSLARSASERGGPGTCRCPSRELTTAPDKPRPRGARQRRHHWMLGQPVAAPAATWHGRCLPARLITCLLTHKYYTVVYHWSRHTTHDFISHSTRH